MLVVATILVVVDLVIATRLLGVSPILTKALLLLVVGGVATVLTILWVSTAVLLVSLAWHERRAPGWKEAAPGWNEGACA